MSHEADKPMGLDAIRERLAGSKGEQYWRSLDEIADTPAFRQFLEDEFPNRLSLLQVDRRQFLKFLGASIAMAGLSGCRILPEQKLVPYVHQPEDLVLGRPTFYATAAPLRGHVIGLLAESHQGRPTKLEGNPNHPASLGATDAIAQASILDLYDPDRSQNVLHLGEVSTWDQFLATVPAAMRAQAARGGAGVRLLTESVLSPTLGEQIAGLLRRLPGARWHQFQPISRDNARAGALAAFGRPVNTVYRFDQATRILSLDADFLGAMPGSVRYARDYAARKQVLAGATEVSRLYVAESTLTITGAKADNRLPLRPSLVEPLARALAAALGADGAAGTPPDGVPEAWVHAVARDLRAHPGRAVVVAGDEQPAAVHALAHAMNAALGAVGKTVAYTEPVEVRSEDHGASLAALVEDMRAGKVEVLIILGGNPVFTAPADLSFGSEMSAPGVAGTDRTPLRIHVGTYVDETAVRCHWHLPESHYLEAWSDLRAHDGTASIVQPLVQPLYETRSQHEVMALLADEPRAGYDIVRGHWQARRPGAGFEVEWERALNEGVIPGTAAPAVAVTASGATPPPVTPSAPTAPGDLEIVFRPDPGIWDGRYANNAWLQELPRPLTKLTWDNAAILSPATAKRLGVDVVGNRASVVDLVLGDRRIAAPVFVLPGHPDDTVAVNLGFGREVVGHVGLGAGFNAYRLRTRRGMGFATGLKVLRQPSTFMLVTTQYHAAMETHGREPVREMTIAEFREDPARINDPEHAAPGPDESLVEAPPSFEHYKGYRWGMSIDTNVCIGCNACVTACQAENNIPVVGKDEVARGREMHWIRIDRYYKGAPDAPTISFQPVLCMQCEKAPCELVCPVGATVHSHEGLNQMVYNRCVGTRYCSNNCPYKVRRFNFYKYTAGQPDQAPGAFDIPVRKLLANPNVTVRGRGVMEKCSYCVQRINVARIEAKKAGREIRDGEVQTACQQSCPTRAIIFGNIDDPSSELVRLKKQPHDYGLLAELGTRPRTTYLAIVRNPNAELNREA